MLQSQQWKNGAVRDIHWDDLHGHMTKSLGGDHEVEFNGICEHKELFDPTKFMDYFGTFVLIILMALATMGGIGGGGVVVLIIQQLLYFDLKEAIALSGFSIFTCSLARYFITYN